MTSGASDHSNGFLLQYREVYYRGLANELYRNEVSLYTFAPISLLLQLEIENSAKNKLTDRSQKFCRVPLSKRFKEAY